MVPKLCGRRQYGETPGAGDYTLTSIALSDQNILKTARYDNDQFVLIPEEGIDEWKSVQKFIKNAIEGVNSSPTQS